MRYKGDPSKKPYYFADIASAALAASGVGEEEEESLEGAGWTGEAERTEGAGRRAWGLVAARLGNKRNRGDFRSAFWFDVTDPNTKQRVPGTVPRMQTRLSQWRDGTAPRTDWSRARENFRRAERRVDELLAQQRAFRICKSHIRQGRARRVADWYKCVL